MRVLGEDDRADDRDRRHEHGRDRRPDDLELRVPVRRRAVGEVVGGDAELPDRVDEHGGDDREDADRDGGRKPEDEVDPRRLLACGDGQPGDPTATAVQIAATTRPITAS